MSSNSTAALKTMEGRQTAEGEHDTESIENEESPSSMRLLASTEHTYSRSIKDTPAHEAAAREEARADISPSSPRSGPYTDDSESNYFKSIQWSPDGTSILTSSADNKLRLFIAPPDLLEPKSHPNRLTPYSTYTSPEPTYAQVFYPGFSLSDPSTTFLLTSPRDLPIQLINALDPSPKPLGNYSLVCPTTEAYQTPSSLLFYPSGNVFYTGTESLIAVFDISRPGEGPTTRLPTIPSKRHKMKGGGVGMRGIISTLALQPDSGAEGASSMLAAGTWTRWVSLYDGEGMGGTVANWSIASAADSEAKVGGAGVSQVLWSGCGRYLYVVERKSRGVMVYDVRVTGKLVAWLEGREADTNQRMTVGLTTTGGTTDIWAGGTNGSVKVWRDVEKQEGGVAGDETWGCYGEETVVGGVGLHQCGSILATASGSKKELFADLDLDFESDSDSASEDEDGTRDRIGASKRQVSEDNSVKIWNFS